MVQLQDNCQFLSLKSGFTNFFIGFLIRRLFRQLCIKKKCLENLNLKIMLFIQDFFSTGRVSMFTSGSENRHMVERVTSGERYALTVSFTCDTASAISDPNPTWNDS
jgi:hypothetical protein